MTAAIVAALSARFASLPDVPMSDEERSIRRDELAGAIEIVEAVAADPPGLLGDIV